MSCHEAPGRRGSKALVLGAGLAANPLACKLAHLLHRVQIRLDQES